jgi:predicted ATPase
MRYKAAMRIAVSGTHRVGKSTLIEELSARLPGYRTLDEPYRVLEEEGHEFSDPPTPEDFERQLRRSLELIEELAEEGRAEVLLDRCPLDFVAYLRALDEDFEIDEWLPELREAMEAIDLIVVVMIEEPDRVTVAAHEDRRLRRDVDEQLRTLVLDDPYDLGVRTLEVHGDVEERVRQVLRAMR